MDADKARDFIRSNNHAVLGTTKSDGSIQLSPVTVAVDDEGRVIISSRETAYKVKNLRRHPRTTVCVFTDKFYGDWIFVEGEAEIVSLPEAMELLVDYYRKGSGKEHPDWDEYRQAMEEQKRVLIRIPIDYAGPTVSG